MRAPHLNLEALLRPRVAVSHEDSGETVGAGQSADEVSGRREEGLDIYGRIAGRMKLASGN